MLAVARPVRVALADGSPFVGNLFRDWLVAAGFTVVGVARDGQTAVDLVQAARPLRTTSPTMPRTMKLLRARDRGTVLVVQSWDIASIATVIDSTRA